MVNDLEKFKFLLEYFVSHLEYLRYRHRKGQALRGRGYAQYILPILSNFKATGQGYNGDGIQNQISNWEKYTCGKSTSGRIFINVQIKFGSVTTATNYLCWDSTYIHILARWSFGKNVITQLTIEDKTPNKAKTLMTKTISELGLFDGNTPNAELKKFWQYYAQFA